MFRTFNKKIEALAAVAILGAVTAAIIEDRVTTLFNVFAVIACQVAIAKMLIYPAYLAGRDSAKPSATIHQLPTAVNDARSARYPR